MGQKATWFMLHRLRRAFEVEIGPFSDTVEVDETFIGGKEKNKHNSKKSHTRGPSGKAVVIGIKNRETNKVVAKPGPERTKEELQGFISANVSQRNQAYTSGIESFWAILKRSCYQTYHEISPKHLGRYVNEFSGGHNIREIDTIDQMAFLTKGMVGKS